MVMALDVEHGLGAARIVMASEADTVPSAVAVIVLVPAATPVTVPVLLTEAIVGALDVQVIVRFVSAVPFASYGVADDLIVSPTTNELAGIANTSRAMLAPPVVPPPEVDGAVPGDDGWQATRTRPRAKSERRMVSELR